MPPCRRVSAPSTIEDVIGLFVEENVEGFKAMIAGMGSATPEAA